MEVSGAKASDIYRGPFQLWQLDGTFCMISGRRLPICVTEYVAAYELGISVEIRLHVKDIKREFKVQ